MKPGFFSGLFTGFMGATVAFAVFSSQFLTYLKEHQPRDRYFATTFDGKKHVIHSLDNPVLTTPQSAEWLQRVALEIYRFGPKDYQERLQHASRHFSRRGWEDFASYLQQEDIIKKNGSRRGRHEGSFRSLRLAGRRGEKCFIPVGL